jgi:hypothetical protein
MKDKKFFKKCPKCGKLQGYTDKRELNKAIKKNTLCSKCSAIEICERPGQNEKICKRMREVANRPDVKKKLKRQYNKRKIKYKGEGNPFFGKHHSKETIKIIKELANNRDYSDRQTDEWKKKSSHPGKLNPMFGKSFYDIWVNKYGKEEADKRMLIKKQKHSIKGGILEV